VYRAKDAVENEDWLRAIQQAGQELELDPDVVSTAEDMFLSSVPDEERSKKAMAAASLYAAALVSGDQRPQGRVAVAMGVSRLSVQAHWKDVVENAGFDAPGW
jgi:transcription initiation factor TFIIIB Brf1 subunit/transcription initiation factor TFIIB